MSVVESKSFHKSTTDKLKLYASVVALIMGIVAFNWSTIDFIIRLAVLIALIGLGIFLVFASAYGRQFVVFFKEAKIELRRVVWPTISETKQMTIMVMIVIAIAIVFLMAADGILRYLLQLFISLR